MPGQSHFPRSDHPNNIWWGPQAPRCVVFSSFQSLPPAYTQISPSAPYSRTFSAYVLPFIRRTKFHTHTKQSYTSAHSGYCINTLHIRYFHVQCYSQQTYLSFSHLHAQTAQSFNSREKQRTFNNSFKITTTKILSFLQQIKSHKTPATYIQYSIINALLISLLSRTIFLWNTTVKFETTMMVALLHAETCSYTVKQSTHKRFPLAARLTQRTSLVLRNPPRPDATQPHCTTNTVQHVNK